MGPESGNQPIESYQLIKSTDDTLDMLEKLLQPILLSSSPEESVKEPPAVTDLLERLRALDRHAKYILSKVKL